jgi:hypothetical protein
MESRKSMQGTKAVSRNVPITPALTERFSSLAPQALARRKRAGMVSHLGEVLQWLLLGGLGLYALFTMEAGPTAVMLLFLVGLYAGILAEGLVYMAARAQVRAQMARLSDDRFVWAMVGALSTGHTEIPDHAEQKTSAGCGLMLDLMFALLCGIAWVLWFRHSDTDVLAILAEPQMRLPLVAVAVLPIITVASTLMALSRGADGAIKAGGRGLALFAMTFTLMFVSESPSASYAVMLVMNLLALAMAALSVFGTVLVRRDTSWLQNHLAAKSTTGA